MLNTTWFKQKATNAQKRSWLMSRIEELYRVNRELQLDIDLKEVTINVNSRDIAKLTMEIEKLSGSHNGRCDQV